MSDQEDSFISHLVELRDRLLRAVVAVVVVFVGLMPWAGDKIGRASCRERV